jgi:AbrB family looped-hinge helix DNA binding protein
MTVVTRKGQITIPAEIRRALDLKEGDKVVVALEGDEVRLRAAGSVIARTAGLLKTRKPPLTAEDLRAAGEQAIAEDAVERLGD